MPPKFFTLDVISKTVRKSDSGSTTSSMEKENIYGIFEPKPTSNLRRSTRIINKKQTTNMEGMNETLNSEIFTENYSRKNNFHDSPENKPNYKPKRKCRSLFKEINRRYAEIENREVSKSMNFNLGNCSNLFGDKFSQKSNSKNNNLFEEDNLWKENSGSKIEPDNFFNEINGRNSFFSTQQSSVSPLFYNFKQQEINSDFSIRLADQLLDEGFTEHAIAECKYNIRKKIKGINYILSGGVLKLPEQVMKREISIEVDDYEPMNTTVNFLSRNEWIFTTPDKQKFVKPTLIKTNVQPAILYRDVDKYTASIYPLNPDDITIDVTKFEIQEPASVPIFAKPLGFFDQNRMNMNTRQNQLFNTNEPSTFARSFQRNISQRSNNVPERSLFNFIPNFGTGNMFI